MNGVTEELLKALEFKKDDDPWWHNMKRAHTKSKEGLEDLKRAIDDGAGIWYVFVCICVVDYIVDRD